MQFIENVNIDLNEHLEKAKLKISKIDELIKSQKKDLSEMEKLKNDFVKEKNEIENKIFKLNEEQILKLEIDKETKNINSPPTEEMEENSPATIHYEDKLVSFLKKEHKDKYISYDLKDCKCFKKNSFKFGDILDTTGNRHYGYTFVGKDGLCENTTRQNCIDSEDGVTVPINICKYLTDAVSKYSNLGFYESCILVYELPYYDVTVQKYNVKKGHMYEYGCWDSECGYNTNKWYLRQINIKTGERTKPTKKRIVNKKVAKKKVTKKVTKKN